MKKTLFVSISILFSVLILVLCFHASASLSEWSSLSENVEALSDGEEVIGGTCCPEPNSICIIMDFVLLDYYYQPEGPCNPI